MAAIPTAGGASYAPRWVMRALLRSVILGGLLVIGWLLGSGTGHADDDPGLPGLGVVHAVTAASADDASSVHPLTRMLPAVSVPRSPIQSPVQPGALRPIVKAVGLPKPLTLPRSLATVLTPSSRPLSDTTSHGAARGTLAAPGPVATVLPERTTEAAAVPTTVARTADFTIAPVSHPAPAVFPCSPASTVQKPLIVQPATGGGLPEGPVPASPPGSNTSACLADGAGAGAGSKGAPDLAVQAGDATATPAKLAGLPPRDTSDLPRSLSTQPSASPD